MDTVEPLLCPGCKKKVPTDTDVFWTWKAEYYCSEACAREAWRSLYM